ncbi:hypothetical protein CC78DRAFT_599817 [Lojkania enalia]|uniref:CorA-like transporter domain-containing protein n=1 Tax=Lojkania enalia TaxID=147567 RepID=A0A9P4KFW8_9PLEO|nr:hypothetical protein CC78DRAFT_599817 [Didymosphaeria enalia]
MFNILLFPPCADEPRYLSSDTSRERLNITRRSLAELFTFHQVMPTYLDFIFVFGRQVDAKDPKFGGFRELKLMKDPPRGFNIPNMGRSGRQFQLCYNLKGVVMKNDEAEDVKMHEWSIRQAAIHHQFDIVYGTTLWIVTKGRRDLYDRIKDMTSQKGREEDRSFATVEECFRSSLGAHLLYCQWAIEGWRWYVRWLENSLMAVYGPRGPGEACQKYKSGDIQVLQYWLDKTNEAVIVLQTNFEVIACLQRFYLSLLTNKDFPERLREKNNDDITSFAAELGEMMTDFGMQISRSRLLADTIRDRKGLILQHIQSEAAERTEQLNINMEREALGMRIITIVTLLFLPATFVSTFFGTDVIKYQKQREEMPGEGSFSALALKRWLQVTIPLTVFTLLLAWITYRLEQTRRRFQNRKQLRHSKRNETPPSPTFPWRSSMSFATTLNPTKFKGFSWMTKRTLSLQLPFHNSDDYQ